MGYDRHEVAQGADRMTDECPVTDCPARPGLVWWTAYSTDETDDKVRKHAAQKLGALPEYIELERTGGCVLARAREEAR